MALADKMGAVAALSHELTTLDRHESKRRGYNPYALGQYLARAEEVRDAVAMGKSLADAFAEGFCATRGMHAVAKRLGLALDVQDGEWVRLPAAGAS